MEQSDLDDITKSLKGDGDAYARLVQRHQNEVAARMWRFTRDRAVLEELVQEVFVEAYFSLRSYRAAAPFSHWLSRIATRVGYRFWKNQKAQAARAAHNWEGWETVVAADDSSLEPAQAAEFLHSLMAQLPPRDRVVLTLLHLEELPVAQAAERLGWSKTMVKVQAFRARRKLKALLEAYEKDSGREEKSP
jgi:RNA polymerase sigma-70 factor, ECF subfamily